MSDKYFVVAQSLPPDFFVMPPAPGVPSPSKPLFDSIKAKVDEMISAGKMVKGTLGTREFPERPGGGNSYVPPGSTSTPSGTNLGWDDRMRPWATNLVYNHDLENGITTVDYPFHRVVPEGLKALRVFLGREAAQEFCDFMLSVGAERMEILTPEQVEALGRQLPDDSIIDQHMETPSGP
jgi:hypothetical protein